MKDELDMMWW